MSSRKRDSNEALQHNDRDKRPSKRLEVGKSTKYDLSYPSPKSAAKAVPFQQPTSLLTFSYSPERVLVFDNSALRYYIDSPLGADLRYGYDRWMKRPEEKGRLDGLLRAVTKIRSKMNASAPPGADWLREIGIVSWRGVMTKILTAPYEDRDAWDMNVMEVNGTVYLEEHLSDARLIQKEDMTPRHRQQTYYGYAFESWSTSSKPGIPDRFQGHPVGWGGDVNTNVQWCSVVKTKLADIRMVIGGEVDCVRDKFTGQPDTFVELKTSMNIRGPQDEERFEKKLLKFYFQSFLLGVPEIVVGFRTPSGQVTTVQSFKTIQLPRLVRGKPHAWDPLICLDWGHRFLSHLRTVICSPDSVLEEMEDERTGDEEQTPKVWRVRFEPGVGISVDMLDEKGVQEVEAGEDRVGFLPRWFWDEAHTRPPSPNQPVERRAEGEKHTDTEGVSEPSGGPAHVPPGWQI